MITVRALLLIAAVLCFLLAAVDVQMRLRPGWLGLMCWALSLLIV
jgi:hypothetical protein